MRLKRVGATALAFGLAGVVSLLTVLPGQAASTVTEVVTPGTLQVDGTHWYFYDDTSDIPSTAQDPNHYEFVSGPANPPVGLGSVFFHDDNPNCPPPVTSPPCQRWDINTSRYAGTPLSNITALKFNTFEPTGTAPGQAIFLNFDVNFGPGVCPPVTCASAGGYQRRLVYVPSVNGTVNTNAWQEWDATAPGALWTWSGYASHGNKWPDGNTSQYRTWSNIVSTFSSASINATPGSSQLVFRAGEPYPAGFTGYLDKVTVGVGANTTIFDFEATPQSKDDCKDGGYKSA